MRVQICRAYVQEREFGGGSRGEQPATLDVLKFVVRYEMFGKTISSDGKSLEQGETSMLRGVG